MKIIIGFFNGTGNPLAAAMQIADTNTRRGEKNRILLTIPS